MQKFTIFSVIGILISLTSSFSQDSLHTNSDSNKIIRNGFYYSYKGKTIRKVPEWESVMIQANDEKVTSLFNTAKGFHYASMPFATVGGFLIGWPIGSMAGGGEFNKPVFFAGVGVASFGIILSIVATIAKKGSIDRFNQLVDEGKVVNFYYDPLNKATGICLLKLQF